jgi:hypothetical protein
MICHKTVYSSGDGLTRSNARLGKKDHEFITTVSPHDVVLSHHRLEYRPDGFDHSVAGEMTAIIVDSLQIIDIQQQQASLRGTPLELNKFARRVTLPGRMIAQTGLHINTHEVMVTPSKRQLNYVTDDTGH